MTFFYDSAPGTAGPFTNEPGFLAYYEMCHLFTEDGWSHRVDSDGNTYAVRGDQWIGYDDQRAIKRKVKEVPYGILLLPAIS